MTPLKLLLHSAVAAVPFAALLALLGFYVSPATPLDLPALWRTLLPLAAVQGAAVAAVWALGLIGLRFFAQRPPAVGWFRFEVFHRFHLADTALAAGVWWTNYLITGALLPGPARRLLLAGCGMITLTWALGALLSLRRVMFRAPRPRLAQAALLLLLPGVLYALRAVAEPAPREARPGPRPGPARADRRVLVVAVEGMSPDFVLPLAAEGRLPQIARMMREGARASVTSFDPPLPAPTWTTAATGLLPRRHGIVDGARWLVAPGGPAFDFAPRGMGFRSLARIGLVDPLPLGPADRRAPAIWTLLDGARLPTAVVGWPVTAPAGRGTGARPEEVAERASRLADWGAGEEAEALAAVARGAIARDLGALDQAARRWEDDRPAALLVYLPGLAVVQDVFVGPGLAPSLRRRPGPPGAAWGEVIARYHRFLDDEIGRLAGSGDRPALVFVLSASGVRRPGPWGLWLGRLPRALPRWPRRPPAGLWLAAGEGVAAGVEVAPAAPADLLPTLLYYLGLPVARDLDGRPRTDLFDPAFTSRRPLTFVPGYGEGR